MIVSTRPFRWRLLVRAWFAALVFGGPWAFAAQPSANDSIFAPITDDPKLPRVLLIGDSISMGYTLPARQILAGKVNLHRIPANGAATSHALERIDTWLGTNKWDVIHFNWGLHDLKIMPGGERQVPLPQYEKNLTALVERLKKTGAKLIFATTTPVPGGNLNPPRKSGEENRYNEVGTAIMRAQGVQINDLNAAIRPKVSSLQRPGNVHFTNEGSRFLAERVAKAIEEACAPFRP